MMPKPKQTKANSIVSKLTDASAPLEMRIELLKQAALAPEEIGNPILAEVLEAAARAKGEDQFAEKTRKLSELIAQMQQGALRCATFDRMLDAPDLGRRAQVILPDGSLASPLVEDEGLAEKMRCGDTVWLEANGRVLLFHAASTAPVGEEGRLERELASGLVEVSVGELGRSVLRPTARLREQLDSGEAEPGCTLVVCQRRMLALQALPARDGLSHYDHLCREPVPDVVVERDIGAPPAFIESLSRHLRREMHDPAIGRRYGMRRSKMYFLAGIPGSGKSHGILGLWNRMYQIMSEMTGLAVEALPQRVMRLRSSEMLSKWVGESDKNIARFFGEIDQLAGETVIGADGRSHELPLLVICEEIDALARERGEDGVHDRIMAELLTGLDPSRPVFRDRLILVVCTTNMPHLVDMAFVRRAGGSLERFGHMNRFGFRAVLDKQLQSRPFRLGDAADAEEARRRTLADVTAWLFGKHAEEEDQVEITFVGQANPVTRHRRHFLTAGLVDRAVQEACEDAAHAEWQGAEDAGFSTELVSRAIARQVQHIVGLLTPRNCERYLELPEGMRVATVRRIAQPSVIPFELERAS